MSWRYSVYPGTLSKMYCYCHLSDTSGERFSLTDGETSEKCDYNMPCDNNLYQQNGNTLMKTLLLSDGSSAAACHIRQRARVNILSRGEYDYY